MSDEKSREKRMKHKVVNLILVYFIINNAFYKIDYITYKYCDKILSKERAAPKSWSEYTTKELKSEKLIK